MCDFWELLHRDFLKNTSDFPSDVIGISYERLIEDLDYSLNVIANFAGFNRRVNIKRIKDIPNEPGKGLRNVVDGTIQIVKDGNQYLP